MASSLPKNKIATDEMVAKSVVANKDPKPKMINGIVDSAKSDMLISSLTARVAELEGELAELDLDNNIRTLRARIQRLEQDVTTYREARDTADFAAIDLRAALDRATALNESLRASPAYRLGTLLIQTWRDWRRLPQLAWYLARWRRENRRLREESDSLLVPGGSATDYNVVAEKALELAETRGLQEAQRWIVDQRLRAPIMARALSELAAFARTSDPQEAIRLAEAALEADPHENRVKRLAFLMADAGLVNDAAKVLRSAIGKGAKFNATEEARSLELLGLADLASAGLTLIPRQQRKAVAPPTTPHVIIFSPQAFPYNWTSVAIRTHAVSLSLIRRGINVDVVTPPGYPDAQSLERNDRPRVRSIDGVSYHLLPHTEERPGISQTYFKQAALLLISFLRRRKATVLVASSELVHGYPAAVAAKVSGARLVFDCWSIGPPKDLCVTERRQLLSQVEDAILAQAQAVLARTPAIGARISQIPHGPKVHLALDAVPSVGEDESPLESIVRGGFVFGYVGDNHPNVDIECLAELLDLLIVQGFDAKLAIYSVGSRILALRDQLKFAGHGSRVNVVSNSPPGRRMDLVYRELDVVVIPFNMGDGAITAPFQIVAALRHNKCVVVIGADYYKDLFGSAVVFVEGVSSAADALMTLSRDPDRRRTQEAEAQTWNIAHPGEQGLLSAIEASS